MIVAARQVRAVDGQSGEECPRGLLQTDLPL